ncbi:HAD family hydrolase [Variovorax arabinosiphilus]|uniref:HAD family hydrolase n=1 Tax=Variovorax arabinosiphilus TaxID=3053498 RepID=UPI0025754D84|nr:MULTISPECIES: HAD family hydrolase [unclassified Variovorax]MDM0119009.1 HAD family hydrolase [Variovorax sp. J2L1-78]MDM0129435.1 HAD family hydrolase [Variovorax sp. J2L1-63]MDM0232779.1 HAD family hydrolase [Variovorax sp. J2R1-6]
MSGKFMSVTCEALSVKKQFFGVKAVAFDVYGTLVHIGDPRRPYRRLLSELNTLGRAPRTDNGARIMKLDVGLAEAAELLGMTLPGDVLQELTVDLSAELASIRLFEDAIPAIRLLQSRGLPIGLCSNLAGPYAKPVQALLPQLDAYAWSFAVGAVKPEPHMYSYLCDALDASPEQVLMVGDTLSADYEGPRSFGMQACHLARKRTSEAKVWISTLLELESLIGS